MPVSEPDSVEQVAAFYAKAAWGVGTTVFDADDPSKVGTIVKRGGGIWVNRDKLPLVRWHGKIDAEPVAWERLTKERK